MARKPSPAWLSFLSHYVTLASHLSSLCTSFLICPSFPAPEPSVLRLPVCFSTSKTSSCQWQTNSKVKSQHHSVNKSHLQGAKLSLEKQGSSLASYLKLNETRQKELFLTCSFQALWRHSEQKMNYLSHLHLHTYIYCGGSGCVYFEASRSFFIFNPAEISIRNQSKAVEIWSPSKFSQLEKNASLQNDH